ncbi:MAG: DUF349 domain-containing protein [Propionibacteriaceae bacterium]|jgi:hypothetical protein|nr:DUF349 domain-containing protein [Propionibacteriaceae bacterium]
MSDEMSEATLPENPVAEPLEPAQDAVVADDVPSPVPDDPVTTAAPRRIIGLGDDDVVPDKPAEPSSLTPSPEPPEENLEEKPVRDAPEPQLPQASSEENSSEGESQDAPAEASSEPAEEPAADADGAAEREPTEPATAIHDDQPVESDAASTTESEDESPEDQSDGVAASARAQERESAKRTKEALITQAELIAMAGEARTSVPEMNKLMEQWRQAGHASKGEDKRLWERFKAARDLFYARLDLERKARQTETAEAKRVKEELIAAAEELTQRSDLRQAQESMTALLAQWKKAPRAPRPVDEALWKRFKAAHDTVYQKFSAERQASGEALRAAAAAKRQLIDEAKGLTALRDRGRAREEMRRINEEFHALGYAGREQNRVLANEFRQAQDAFYTTLREAGGSRGPQGGGSGGDRGSNAGERGGSRGGGRGAPRRGSGPSSWSSDQGVSGRSSALSSSYDLLRFTDAASIRAEIARLEHQLENLSPSGASKRSHGGRLTLNLDDLDQHGRVTADLMRLRLRLAQVERMERTPPAAPSPAHASPGTTTAEAPDTAPEEIETVETVTVETAEPEETVADPGETTEN